MRRVLLLLAVASLTWAGPPSAAEMCSLDAVPAATLLLPYFEVDLAAEPGVGVNTVFTIHNALPSPTIAHLALWTDWSQPVIDFDVFLTGYDAQTVDLYDLLVRGNIPVTADEQSDQGQDGGRVADPTSLCDGTVDSCSPHGHRSWDGSFTGAGIPWTEDCIEIFPFFVNPLLSGARLDEIQAKLTGQRHDGACYGADHGDAVARGYVTIDNARACSLLFPFDPGYFSDGVDPGVVSDVNQLWGDWALVDPQNQLTLAVDPLIHVEADPAFDGSSTPTGATFYRRYAEPLGAADHREPLGSAWSFNYRTGLWLADLVVWRDSTANDQSAGGYACGSGPGSGPDWQPLGQTQVVCFDEIENAVEICSEAACFPLESQRLEFGVGDLAVPKNFGWCFLNLDLPGGAAQSWVGATHRQAAAVSGGLNAILWAHACQDASPVIDAVRRPAGPEGGSAEWRSEP